jgi:hypothetical protein
VHLHARITTRFERLTYSSHRLCRWSLTCFYDLPNDDQLIETWLSGKESQGAQAISELLNMDEIKLSDSLRVRIATYLYYQYCRTKLFRSQTAIIRESSSKGLIDYLIGEEDASLAPRIEFPSKFDAAYQAYVLQDEQKLHFFVKAITSHIWEIGKKHKGSKNLYTSDEPLIIDVPDTWVQDPIFLAEGVQILFPLSPTHILIISEKSRYKDRKNNDGKVINIDDTDVEKFNRLQVIESSEEIFSSTNDFQLAVDMCQDYPELCNYDRKRVDIDFQQKNNGVRIITRRIFFRLPLRVCHKT